MVKMAGDAVQFKDTNDKDTKNALVTLQAAQEAPKSLSRKERQQERQKTSGGGWFDMPLGEMTEENKRDLQILRMRHVLDRKRHYRKMDKKHQPKYFQIGTLVESPTEFFSARLNRKDRKQTLAEEIMGDAVHTDYYKRKYSEIQEAKTSGGKRHHKKKLAKRR
ncbi:Fcf2-domain-containing protein [Hesseltinella vesiculosa]|uniref:Fcf2-domain-containing protein n=1 Tax=Hesseltinella vesiculosa TaxID=101127 RepID=A0A1X2G9M4_9FUNG|nr:Fcf2-domain-containing protein [Hesseltinella vesiculosa]